MSGSGDYGVVREGVLAEAREQARILASQGLVAREIEHRLGDELTAAERELLWGALVREALAEAGEPLAGLRLWAIEGTGEISVTDATELDERFW